MRIDIPDYVKEFMEIILNKGYEIYLVGGVVRDYLLGKNTKDYDFATDARPPEIKRIFHNYHILDYGEEHGTVAIHYQDTLMEITTYRIEDEYTDGRRPDEVKFVNDLKLDLDRRDFTINALAADIDGNIIDYHNGLADFQQGIIRCVGNPTDRFEEDSLRMLRAIRFSLRLDFELDYDTANAIRENVELINIHDISGERIQVELSEIMGYTMLCFEILADTHLLDVIFPPLDTSLKRRLISLSKDVEKNNQLISWALLLFILEENGNEIRDIFASYPGYGKFKENQFFEGCNTLQRFTTFEQKLVRDDQLRLIRPSFNRLSKYPEFDFGYFLEMVFFSLSPLSQGVHDYTSRSHREGLVEMFPITVPVSGDFFVKMGLDGVSIGAAMELFKLFQLYNRFTRSEIRDLFDLLVNKPIDILMLQNLLATDNPTDTKLQSLEMYYAIEYLQQIRGNLEIICHSVAGESLLVELVGLSSSEAILPIEILEKNYRIKSEELRFNENISIRQFSG